MSLKISVSQLHVPATKLRVVFDLFYRKYKGPFEAVRKMKRPT